MTAFVQPSAAPVPLKWRGSLREASAFRNPDETLVVTIRSPGKDDVFVRNVPKGRYEKIFVQGNGQITVAGEVTLVSEGDFHARIEEPTILILRQTHVITTVGDWARY